MADIAEEIRPAAELLRLLRSEGVRPDNRVRLQRQLADLQATITRFSETNNRAKLAGEEAKQVLDTIREQIRFIQEARRFLDESIVATEKFVSILAQDGSREPEDAQSRKRTPLRARPVREPIDHEALSREFIARFPKIRARLAD